MVIAMAIIMVTGPVTGPDIMQVNVPHTTGLALIRPEPDPPITLITIALRGLEKPGINNIIQGRGIESLVRIERDPLHNQPTGPIMCIQIAMGTYIGKMATIGTGWIEPIGEAG